MYGETTGETDDFGLPVRYNWSADYRGKATVVYGHTPVPEPVWLNNTVNIDTVTAVFTNTKTGVTTTVLTNHDGLYHGSNLQPDVSRFEGDSAGFSTGIRLLID